MTPLTCITLHGELAARFGRRWRLAVRSPAEAVAAIEANHPGFQAHLAASGRRGVEYRILAGGRDLTPADLTAPLGMGSLHIVPVLAGGFGTGVGETIMGSLLVAGSTAAGKLITGLEVSAAMKATAFTIAGLEVTWGAIAKFGAVMALSGAAQMLAGHEQAGLGTGTGVSSEDAPGLASASFTGALSLGQPGTAVPAGYGRMLVDGIPISTGVTISEDSDNDSLSSTAWVRIIDLIGEGPIEGFADPAAPWKNIYLDGTPVMAADGDYNFESDLVAMEAAAGTAEQDPLCGWEWADLENTVEVNTQVTQDTPVTRTISDTTMNSVAVVIGVPKLMQTDDDDDGVKGATVECQLKIEPTSGTVSETTLTISGYTKSRFQRGWSTALEGEGPWNITISRITDDHAGDTDWFGETWWDLYVEQRHVRLNYRHRACVGVKYSAELFSGMPRRQYLVRQLKVLVPANYDPETRTYTGAWDGTFKSERAYTSNPAWCYYDMLTSRRYGLGRYIADNNVNKWALYAIARYCDAVDEAGGFVGVDDGYGGQEPRFVLHCQWRSRKDAYRLLAELAAAFQGMVYWAGGQVSAVQDAPADPVALYTNANVEEGVFNYAGTALRARHTVALVERQDPDNMYENDVVRAKHASGLARYGYRPVEIKGLGAMSKGQAQRLGRWVLHTENDETETVSFITGRDGLPCRPGQKVQTMDAARAGSRFGGRISAAGTTWVDIDKPVTLEDGQDYTLTVLDPEGKTPAGSWLPATAYAPGERRWHDDTAYECVQSTNGVDDAVTEPGAGSGWADYWQVIEHFAEILLTRQLVNLPGETSTLAWSAPLDAAPQTQSVWMLSATGDLVPELWTVLTVDELGAGRWKVLALFHNPTKYGAVEEGLTLAEPPTSNIADIMRVLPPENVQISEQSYVIAGIRKIRVEVSWDRPDDPYIRGYICAWRRDGGNWHTLAETPYQVVSHPEVMPGTYDVRVQSINIINKRSRPVYTTAAIGAATGPPAFDDSAIPWHKLDNYLPPHTDALRPATPRTPQALTKLLLTRLAALEKQVQRKADLDRLFSAALKKNQPLARQFLREIWRRLGDEDLPPKKIRPGYPYAHLKEPPGQLSDINTTEGDKLAGVEPYATYHAHWGYVSGRPTWATDDRVPTALDSSGTVITRLLPGANATPDSAGIYVGADYLGYYDGNDWTSYINADGDLILAGSLSWIAATSTLTISNGTIRANATQSEDGFAAAVIGTTAVAGGLGVYGVSRGSGGSGVRGRTNQATGYGVRGDTIDGTGTGVYGTTAGGGRAMHAYASGPQAIAMRVEGVQGADALEVVGSAEITGSFQHSGSTAAFFGGTPTTQPGAYQVTNWTARKTLDCDNVTLADLADVVGTIIHDLHDLSLTG